MQTISTTLRPGTHQDYVEQAQGRHQLDRMRMAERRRLILEADWRPLVIDLLWRYRYQPEVLGAVAARVKRSPNVALKALRKVTVAYKVPPVRTIDGASEATTAAYKRVVLEQGELLSAPQRWEKLVWGMNTIITVPTVKAAPAEPFGRQLVYEVLLPSNTEVVTPDASASSRPIASVTMFCIGESRDNVWVVLDDEAWTTYDTEGTFIARAPHNAGIWPGTVWRRIRGSDWWGQHIGQGLFDATLEASHVAARRDWIRKGQDHKREILFAPDVESLGRTVSGSDAATEVPLDKDDADYKVLDPTISIERHQEHVTALGREGAETLDIDPDLIDFAPGTEALDPLVASQKHDDLKALRRATIQPFSIAERDNAWKTALVLRGSRHPLSSLLQPSLIREGFKAEWSELDFVDEPEARMNVLNDEIDLGLKSTVDAIKAQHPGMSREQAKAESRRIDEEEAERALFLAERNIPRLVRDRRSNVAELQGRIGGMVGGEARRENNDDDGNSERSTDAAGTRERDAGTTSPGARSRAGRRSRGRRRRA